MKRHIPNMLTCCNLISGCIATFFAFYSVSHVAEPNLLGHYYQLAFFFIIIGAVFDFFDGFVARLLKVSSPIGLQLDSLADVVTFGVAPGAMIFSLVNASYWKEMADGQTIFVCLPFIAFLLPAFAALRLAKFNLDERQHDQFIGLPTPACAIFWAALIASSANFFIANNIAWLLFVGITAFSILMVSELPMFSLKFKTFSPSGQGNKIRFVFLAITLVTLVAGSVWGVVCGRTLVFILRALVLVIATYILLSVINAFVKKR